MTSRDLRGLVLDPFFLSYCWHKEKGGDLDPPLCAHGCSPNLNQKPIILLIHGMVEGPMEIHKPIILLVIHSMLEGPREVHRW